MLNKLRILIKKRKIKEKDEWISIYKLKKKLKQIFIFDYKSMRLKNTLFHLIIAFSSNFSLQFPFKGLLKNLVL